MWQGKHSSIAINRLLIVLAASSSELMGEMVPIAVFIIWGLEEETEKKEVRECARCTIIDHDSKL